MTNSEKISHAILASWLDKIRKDKTIPKSLIEDLEALHETGDLTDMDELRKLITKLGEDEDDQT